LEKKKNGMKGKEKKKKNMDLQSQGAREVRKAAIEWPAGPEMAPGGLLVNRELYSR